MERVLKPGDRRTLARWYVLGIDVDCCRKTFMAHLSLRLLGKTARFAIAGSTRPWSALPTLPGPSIS